jgi:hypothetical protein
VVATFVGCLRILKLFHHGGLPDHRPQLPRSLCGQHGSAKKSRFPFRRNVKRHFYHKITMGWGGTTATGMVLCPQGEGGSLGPVRAVHHLTLLLGFCPSMGGCVPLSLNGVFQRVFCPLLVASCAEHLVDLFTGELQATDRLTRHRAPPNDPREEPAGRARTFTVPAGGVYEDVPAATPVPRNGPASWSGVVAKGLGHRPLDPRPRCG